MRTTQQLFSPRGSLYFKCYGVPVAYRGAKWDVLPPSVALNGTEPAWRQRLYYMASWFYGGSAVSSRELFLYDISSEEYHCQKKQSDEGTYCQLCIKCFDEKLTNNGYKLTGR